MPVQVERNYLPMAISMNEKAWAKQAPCYDKVDANYEAIITKNAHRRQAALLNIRRSHIVSHIEAAKRAALFFHSPMLRHAKTEHLHVGEVIEAIQRGISRQINRGKSGHYLFDAEKLKQLREALLFARYFRRFGFRIWRMYQSTALQAGFSAIASRPHKQQVAA